MRLNIIHQTSYRYDTAPSLIVQALRMWPAAETGQVVRNWRVEVDGKLLSPSGVDGFGNPAATHTVDRPVSSVQIVVRGQVDTRDNQGIHRGGIETLPPMFFLSPTALTQGSEDISALARRSAGVGGDLERLHNLCNGVRDAVDYLPAQTNAETTAVEALALGAGVCQDHAHVMISAARSLGFCARYVSGYLCAAENGQPAASHAWAEIFVDDLGWVGFDAANRQCPDERYVRIASGRDYRDAAPVRGVRLGGVIETLEVHVQIVEAMGGNQ